MPKKMTPPWSGPDSRAAFLPPRPLGSMRPSTIAAALAAIAVLVLTGCGEKKKDAGKGAPPEVGVVIVSTQDAPMALELPGRLAASQIASAMGPSPFSRAACAGLRRRWRNGRVRSSSRLGPSA